MKAMKFILFFIGLLLTGLVIAQPANDNCTGSTVVPQDGTCVNGTTVAATDSWSGAVGCQSADGHPDVWFTFTATGTQADLVVTNGTMTGNVEIIFVLANCNSQNCNCPFLLAGNDCAASPNSITVTPLIVGETYYYTISSSTGSQGTFSACLTVTTPPPPPPAPGQDCNTAATLCGGPDFTVGLMALGDGLVEENAAGAWSTCIGDETSSQWYVFTAGIAGTYSLLVEPDNWTAPQTGDDYDWEFYDITTSGCTNSATNIACDYDPCRGSTGFSATGAAGFSQVGGVDYMNNNPIGPADCTGGPQWNSTAVSLVAGNTYALMIQNYSGSTGGVTVSSGGTAVFGPQSAFTFTSSCGADNIASVAADYPNTVAGWTFSWDWGDGSADDIGTTASHTYAATGNYNVTLTVTDPLGCTSSAFASTYCNLPIELLSFDGEEIDNDVHLKWSTASESNNDYFTIEKSIDGIVYEKIGTVDAVGNSSVINHYSMIDPSPFLGRNYYRLRQTDVDGRYVTYDPIMFNKVDKELNLAVFPNPAKEVMNIDYSSDSFEEVFVKMTDMNGKLIYRTALQPSMARKINWQINTSEIEEGIYILYISQGDKTSYKKIVLE